MRYIELEHPPLSLSNCGISSTLADFTETGRHPGPLGRSRCPLDPKGSAARVKTSGYPGGTFRVLKEKEIK